MCPSVGMMSICIYKLLCSIYFKQQISVLNLVELENFMFIKEHCPRIPEKKGPIKVPRVSLVTYLIPAPTPGIISTLSHIVHHLRIPGTSFLSANAQMLIIIVTLQTIKWNKTRDFILDKNFYFL